MSFLFFVGIKPCPDIFIVSHFQNGVNTILVLRLAILVLAISMIQHYYFIGHYAYLFMDSYFFRVSYRLMVGVYPLVGFVALFLQILKLFDEYFYLLFVCHLHFGHLSFSPYQPYSSILVPHFLHLGL